MDKGGAPGPHGAASEMALPVFQVELSLHGHEAGGVMLRTQTMTGMRPGETLGAKPEDVLFIPEHPGEHGFEVGMLRVDVRVEPWKTDRRPNYYYVSWHTKPARALSKKVISLPEFMQTRTPWGQGKEALKQTLSCTVSHCALLPACLHSNRAVL